jgi:hypothetical protein
VRAAALLVASACLACRHEPPGATTPGDSGSSALHGVPCGPLDCHQYDSARDAFVDALASGPLVVAIGEAHAQKGAVVASSARRFTEELLPTLAGKASDLVVELMMPPTGCVDATAQVREEQRAVTSRQAEGDQNEYLSMGDRARGLGIVPDMLRPSCADMDAVRSAGEGAVGESLKLIATLTTVQARRLVDRDARSDADRGKMVVVYGGMLHNDLAPPPDRAQWCYAPDLDTYVRGKLVAIDLIVPEYVGEDDAWRSLPWWSSYDRDKLGAKVTMLRTGERSFVIVFARTGPGATPRD